MVEIGSNVKSNKNGRTEMTFEHDLWDQLPKITQYTQSNFKNISIFKDFNQDLAKLTYDFAVNLRHNCTKLQLIDTSNPQLKRP